MDLDQDMYDDNYDGTTEVIQCDVQKAVDQPQQLSSSRLEKRDNALHLRGTDDMSTADVHKYLSLYSTESKPRIEWIDDASLNLVYYTSDDARIALAHLTVVPTDQVDSTTSHPAQPNPEKSDARLFIRYANTMDKKERGAKDRSRWYLFHPEDDPDSRSRQQRRRRTGGDEPYSKNGRHERRLAAGTAGGVDLFASRLGLDASELPPVNIKRDLFEEKVAGLQQDKGSDKQDIRAGGNSGEDKFASRVSEAAKTAQRLHAKDAGARATLPANDLFARVGPATSLPLAARISSSSSAANGSSRSAAAGTVELFPEKLYGDAIVGQGGDLSSRISGGAAGGPARSNNRGLSIRGAGTRRARASDLF